MRMIDFVIALGDLFMPRACLACGRRLGMRERHLCLSCAADVPYTRFWLAPHNPLADRFNAVLERHRGTEPMDYAYAAALLYYKGAYRAIPRALKYQGDLAAGRHYGALLGRRLAAAPHFADIDLVIPVPLHWTRLRSRGYNQAEILDAFRVAPAPPGASERWPVAAGHDEGVTPTASSGTPSTVIPGAPSTVIPGLTRNLPEVRTDLLVRARRTRTQTRVRSPNASLPGRGLSAVCPTFSPSVPPDGRSKSAMTKANRPGRMIPVIPGLTGNRPPKSSHRPATSSSWTTPSRPAPPCTPATPPSAPSPPPASPSPPSPPSRAPLRAVRNPR